MSDDLFIPMVDGPGEGMMITKPMVVDGFSRVAVSETESAVYRVADGVAKFERTDARLASDWSFAWGRGEDEEEPEDDDYADDL